MPCNRGIHQCDGLLDVLMIDDIQFIIKKYFIAVWRATYGENTYLFLADKLMSCLPGQVVFPSDLSCPFESVGITS